MSNPDQTVFLIDTGVNLGIFFGRFQLGVEPKCRRLVSSFGSTPGVDSRCRPLLRLFLKVTSAVNVG